SASGHRSWTPLAGTTAYWRDSRGHAFRVAIAAGALRGTGPSGCSAGGKRGAGRGALGRRARRWRPRRLRDRSRLDARWRIDIHVVAPRIRRSVGCPGGGALVGAPGVRLPLCSRPVELKRARLSPLWVNRPVPRLPSAGAARTRVVVLPSPSA